MAWRVEQNPTTGQPEIVVDGWENGLASSPYSNEGMPRMLNLNPWYYPGALYSNYKRVTAGTPTIGVIYPWLFTTSNPAGPSITSGSVSSQTAGIDTQYIIADQSGATFSATGQGDFAVMVNHAIPHASTGVTGVCYYSPTLYPGSPTETQFMFAWGNSGVNQRLYYSNFNSSWQDWALVTGWSTSTTVGLPNYAIWAKDNNMYICNGRFVSLFGLDNGNTSIPDSDFNPGGTAGTNYVFEQQQIVLPSYENATWLGELGDNLLVASGNRIYPYPFASFQTATPIQFSEPVNKFIVINNLIYVLAGQKGNIYISNTYSWSFFQKIPDSFFGVTDPNILWGGIMVHRNKLYVGVTETKTLISGTFSIDLTTRDVNFENQNSFGLTASGSQGYGQPEILFDYNASSTDFYYSAFYNNSAGGVNKSSTTLPYESGETFFETDLVPTGTYLTKTTPVDVEFKLDSPMTTGDTIQIFGRGAYSDSYVSFGTFTSTGTEVGSAFTSIPLRDLQWLQLKVVITTAGGDFVRLVQIRIRNGR